MHNIEWAAFHPFLIHFPIVLFSAALICDLLYGIGKKGALVVGHWMIICGALLIIPTILTGLEAAKDFDSNDVLLASHKLFGFITGIYAIGYAIYRTLIYKNKWEVHPIIIVLLSLILVGLMLKTSDLGGLLTHGKTPLTALFGSFY